MNTFVTNLGSGVLGIDWSYKFGNALYYSNLSFSHQHLIPRTRSIKTVFHILQLLKHLLSKWSSQAPSSFLLHSAPPSLPVHTTMTTMTTLSPWPRLLPWPLPITWPGVASKLMLPAVGRPRARSPAIVLVLPALITLMDPALPVGSVLGKKLPKYSS